MTEEDNGDFAAFEAQVQSGEAPADPPSGDTPAPPEELEVETEVEAEPETEELPEEEETPKPREKSAKERIAELTRARREAERERDELRERLQERERPAAPVAEAEDDGPKPDDYELGEFDPKYIAENARHAARKEFAVLQAEAAMKAEFQQKETAYNKRVADAAGKYPDYEEVVRAAADTGNVTPPIAVAILESEVGPDVAYFLATNMTEAKRIAGLPEHQQHREIGRLEAKFLNAPQSKVTTAPPPPANRTRGAGGQFAPDPTTADFATFEKMVNAGK